ncbi:unnamed protein product [Pleuronectes platessa]|uniref:Uncharacterized protein n=1 Tax=Pleuronectes platessa TaxID=8262 RepID=A0A9N7TN98_PLEPL|nr:unnamed protein product [Pleuronectes platessa]
MKCEHGGDVFEVTPLHLPTSPPPQPPPPPLLHRSPNPVQLPLPLTSFPPALFPIWLAPPCSLGSGGCGEFSSLFLLTMPTPLPPPTARPPARAHPHEHTHTYTLRFTDQLLL